MKRRIIQIGLICCMIFTICSVYSSAEYAIPSFGELIDISVISQEYKNVDLECSVKRGEAIEIFLVIAEEDSNILKRITEEHKNQEILNWKYIDIADGSKECALVAEASSIGLMQGEYISNKNERYARMDDYITWEECLYLCNRILSKGYGYVYMRVDEAVKVYEYLYPDEEPIIKMSEDIGLINQDNIAFSSFVNVEKENLNQSVSWREFAEIIHRMLYIPTETEGYGGTYYRYRIEAFR